MDNCELRVSNIYIPEGATLRIEAQSSSTSTGKLIVESNTIGDAAIGSPKGNGNNKGNLIIKGGDITATSTGGGAGIGSGYEAEFGNVTINGGIVKATGSSGGAGIGAGIGGSSTSTKSTCGNITINNGMVTAKGGNTGSGIGCGGAHSSVGKVTINGGIVNAEGGSNNEKNFYGVGIGASTYGKCDGIAIASSVVTATGQKDHKGINGTVSINDSAVVFANGGFSDRNNSGSWKGVVFEGSEGAVYGTNVTPTESFEVGKGKRLRIDSSNSLTINSGKAMTVKGEVSGEPITNNGIIRVMQGASMNPRMVNGANSHAVILYPGDGVDLGDTPERTYGEDLALPELVRIGYTFGGWYRNVDYTEDSITNVPRPTSDDTDCYAKWTPKQYMISFDSDGGSAVDAITQDYDTNVSAPAAPSRTGHTFIGWFKGNESLPYVFGKMPAENIALKAKWSINTYTISFDSAGGSAVSSISGHHGDKVAAPAAPTRDGYSFEGWFRDGDSKPYEFTTMPAANVSLKAKWTAIHYHSAVGVAAKAATCTEPGLTEGSKCSSCSAVLKAQESVLALGHEWGAWSVTKPATLKKAGTEARSCQNAGCAESQTRELARLASKTVKVKGVSYLCDGKTAVVVGASKKLKKAAIPATVKIDGVKHPVTGITADAFKGCKGLKSITVTSKRLTKKSVKGSLKGSSVEKVVVKVGDAKANKACAKKYKKLFAAKVCGKKGVKVVAWKKAAR